MFYALTLALVALLMPQNAVAQTEEGVIFHANFKDDMQGFEE